MTLHHTISIIAILYTFSASIKACPSHSNDIVMRQTINTPCVHNEAADLFLPNDSGRIFHFYNKLADYLQTQQGRINILHIGGSHVQAGYLSGRIRENLCSITDSNGSSKSTAADRGILFPFSAINTKGPSDYLITCSGHWKGSRCISNAQNVRLGLSGAAAITADSAAMLTITVDSTLYSFDTIRILGYGSNQNVCPIVVTNDSVIHPSKSNTDSDYLFCLPHQASTINIRFEGLDGDNQVVLRGMLPMSNRSGITYSESGINGATVASWLSCKALDEELRLIMPDLVVFGIGINDAAMQKNAFNAQDFKMRYRQLIDMILRINPKAALLFITNNDCYQSMRVKRYNHNTIQVEKAFIQLAKEYNGAVFNLFRIMGGPHSSALWVKHGLMKHDRIHFTADGYRLVGDLLYNALMRGMQKHIDTKAQ